MFKLPILTFSKKENIELTMSLVSVCLLFCNFKYIVSPSLKIIDLVKITEKNSLIKSFFKLIK